MAVRLNSILPEYADRVRLRMRPVPLELHGEAAPRDILEQEWWLAALQEPRAAFGPIPDDWPTTTLPAFDAAWCAAQQGEEAGHAFDLRVRRAFFGEGRNIGKPEVMLEIARETGLDFDAFKALFESDKPRSAVLAEAQEGRDRFRVRGTPTLMLPDGSRLHPQLAEPTMRNRKIVSIDPLPCYGDGCDDAVRELFEAALQQGGETVSS